MTVRRMTGIVSGRLRIFKSGMLTIAMNKIEAILSKVRAISRRRREIFLLRSKLFLINFGASREKISEKISKKESKNSAESVRNKIINIEEPVVA